MALSAEVQVWDVSENRLFHRLAGAFGQVVGGVSLDHSGKLVGTVAGTGFRPMATIAVQSRPGRPMAGPLNPADLDGDFAGMVWKLP